ncbi:MAG: myo-inositol-1(or 4)-monophosphatase [Paraglaciecola sp.]|jgi:myo-inositol-1(or 4)-monophosphatase
MTTTKLEKLTAETCEIVRQVAEFILAEKGKVKTGQIEVKSKNSLVSYVDKNAEKQLVEGLQKLLPESVFLTEEETIENQTGDYQWIIDPLDGTTNFLHDLPCFSISVALRFKEELVIGVVHEVNENETFYAYKNGGAYLNGSKIKVTPTTTLSESLIATGFPYYDYSKVKSYLTMLEYLMQETRGIRRFGSAAVDLVYVACGRFDGFFEYSLNAWDVAAGILIVQEAGGQVCDFNGGNDYLFGKEIVATNSGIATEFQALVTRHFSNNNTSFLSNTNETR